MNADFDPSKNLLQWLNATRFDVADVCSNLARMAGTWDEYVTIDFTDGTSVYKSIGDVVYSAKLGNTIDTSKTLDTISVTLPAHFNRARVKKLDAALRKKSQFKVVFLVLLHLCVYFRLFFCIDV